MCPVPSHRSRSSTPTLAPKPSTGASKDLAPSPVMANNLCRPDVPASEAPIPASTSATSLAILGPVRFACRWAWAGLQSFPTTPAAFFFSPHLETGRRFFHSPVHVSPPVSHHRAVRSTPGPGPDPRAHRGVQVGSIGGVQALEELSPPPVPVCGSTIDQRLAAPDQPGPPWALPAPQEPLPGNEQCFRRASDPGTAARSADAEGRHRARCKHRAPGHQPGENPQLAPSNKPIIDGAPLPQRARETGPLARGFQGSALRTWRKGVQSARPDATRICSPRVQGRSPRLRTNLRRLVHN